PAPGIYAPLRDASGAHERDRGGWPNSLPRHGDQAQRLWRACGHRLRISRHGPLRKRARPSVARAHWPRRG
ncbi:unnamed protein product, partial [Symbiodinium natans]